MRGEPKPPRDHHIALQTRDSCWILFTGPFNPTLEASFTFPKTFLTAHVNQPYTTFGSDIMRLEVSEVR